MLFFLSLDCNLDSPSDIVNKNTYLYTGYSIHYNDDEDSGYIKLHSRLGKDILFPYIMINKLHYLKIISGPLPTNSLNYSEMYNQVLIYLCSNYRKKLGWTLRAVKGVSYVCTPICPILCLLCASSIIEKAARTSNTTKHVCTAPFLDLKIDFRHIV